MTRVISFLGTLPNISESHSEISTRVPFCITQARQGSGASSVKTGGKRPCSPRSRSISLEGTVRASSTAQRARCSSTCARCLRRALASGPRSRLDLGPFQQVESKSDHHARRAVGIRMAERLFWHWGERSHCQAEIGLIKPIPDYQNLLFLCGLHVPANRIKPKRSTRLLLQIHRRIQLDDAPPPPTPLFFESLIK